MSRICGNRRTPSGVCALFLLAVALATAHPAAAQRIILTDTTLGAGSYGDVFVGEDPAVPPEKRPDNYAILTMNAKANIDDLGVGKHSQVKTSGEISNNVTLSDHAAITMYGGYSVRTIYLYDNASATIYGGAAQGGVTAYGASVIHVYGGTGRSDGSGSLIALDNARLTVSGGVFNGVGVDGSARGVVTGGSFTGSVSGVGGSGGILDIAGGMFHQDLDASDGAHLDFYGGQVGANIRGFGLAGAPPTVINLYGGTFGGLLVTTANVTVNWLAGNFADPANGLFYVRGGILNVYGSGLSLSSAGGNIYNFSGVLSDNSTFDRQVVIDNGGVVNLFPPVFPVPVFVPAAAAPEPNALALLALGGVSLGLLARRRR